MVNDMRCSYYACENNDDGYCGCIDSIEIDEDGCCDSISIPVVKEADGNG